MDQRTATVTLSITVREQDAPAAVTALADALGGFLSAPPQIVSLSLSSYPDDEETVTAAGE